MGSFLSVMIMLGLISVLIIAHELGHFWVAKKCGIRVDRFGFGLPFGPTLWSKQVGETEYCLHAALFGGYVAFPDDNPDSDLPKDSPLRFENKTVLQRFAVAVAGVTVNAILGWAIMTGVVMAWGLPDVQGDDVSIGMVLSAQSAAAEAGIQSGDHIVSVGAHVVNQRPLEERTTFVKDRIHASALKPVVLGISRQGQLQQLTVTPNKDGLIGVQLMLGDKVYIKESNPLTASAVSIEYLSHFVMRNFQALGQMVTGNVDAAQLSGPLRIVDEGRKVIEANGIQDGLILTAIISVILAVMNLLPIPALDGGHILFLLVEAIKGSPVNKDLQERFVQVGFLSLLALMAFVVINDVNNIWVNPFDKQYRKSAVVPAESRTSNSVEHEVTPVAKTAP